MKVDVIMPKMGESINEGTIIKWHKKVGDHVKRDEILFEISTDKVDTEIPSPEEGILQEIKVYEQETVEVDTVVAILETNGKSEAKDSKENQEVQKPKEEKSTKQVGGNLIDIPMPKMGESVMEGTIIKWHKKIGDVVKKDETLFEISTDKVDTEVPSPEEGTLAEILVSEQETVEVGTVVAKISSKSGVQKESSPQTSAPQKEEKQIVTEGKSELEQTQNVQPESRPQQKVEHSGNRFYSPLVMNIAQKENVSYDELEQIEGSGVEGRVTKKDILQYLEDRKKSDAPKPQQKQVQTKPQESYSVEQKQEPARQSFQSSNDVELIPMDNIRQKIMHHMVQSRDTSVHVSGIIEVDMTKIDNFIKNNKENFLNRENIKLTYMPFIAYACVNALKAYPYVNSSLDGTNIAVKKYINLGFAVAVEPNGLIVPNIKNADDKNIRGLAKAIGELSYKSRNKKLSPDDISGGTFTITNYGVFGTLFGNPIINQPEVAILGVGSITKKPVVIEVDGSDVIAIRSMMYLSLSHDHRIIDGMLGGKFLKHIKDTLENFDTNLI